VRNLTTTAEKSADGSHYIVNGEKKWITNGLLSDYFCAAVRTGAEGSGAAGLSFLLIDRHLPGISCRKIDIGAGKLSATTYITFEDVKVPAEYLVGEEGGGFKFIMSNFNHERIWIVFQALRMARICLEDAFAWAMKREVFGGKLIEQPVVRHKLGICGKKVEALQAWTEQIVYELDHLDEKEGNRRLGGTTALLKVEAGESIRLWLWIPCFSPALSPQCSHRSNRHGSQIRRGRMRQDHGRVRFPISPSLSLHLTILLDPVTLTAPVPGSASPRQAKAPGSKLSPAASSRSSSRAAPRTS
jgi:hypothetical protein